MSEVGRSQADPNASECIVLGAGLIGLSIALHLRWQGLSVRVLERGRVGDGTSTRSSGWISASLRTPNSLLELVLASLRYFPELVARLDDDCDHARCGTLVLFDSEEQLAQRRLLDGEQRRVAAYGGARFLDAREVREIEPAVAPTIVGGAYWPDDAEVDPIRLVAALHRAAVAAGAAVHQGAEAQAVGADGSGWRVTTPIGVFTADRLVNAAGAWSPAVAELSDLELEVIPVAGQLLVSTPQRTLGHTCLIYQPDPRFATRLACGIRPAPDGRLWMGTTYRPGSFDTTVTAEDTRAILDAVKMVIPALRDVEVERAWAGVRPVPADLVPIYGRATAADEYYVAVPVAGLAETAIAGRAMAELIATGRSATPLEAFAPDRFAADA